MKNRIHMATASALVLTFALALPASALSVRGIGDITADTTGEFTNAIGVEGTVDGSLESATTGNHGQGVSGEARLITDVSAQVRSGIGENLRSMLNALIGGSVSLNDDEGTATASDDRVSADASGRAGLAAELSSTQGTVLVTRADITTGDAEATSVDVSAVDTQADLEGFLAAYLVSDTDIESIEVASDSISLTFKDSAMLFGILPVIVDATATVDVEGNVEVSYPWYAMLMTTDKEQLEQRIEARIATEFARGSGAAATTVAATGSTQMRLYATEGAAASAMNAENLSAEQKARLVSEIHTVISETEAETSASGSVDIR